jgi:6-methylsalicylate decarboxylase
VPSCDVHQHLWPPQLVEALSTRRAPPLLRDGVLVVDPEGEFALDPADLGLGACLDRLDRAGIELAVVSCQPTLGIEDLPEEEGGLLRHAYHTGAAEIVDESGGRVCALAMGEALDGFVGASVPATALGDLGRLESLLAELERRRQLLFVHPGPARVPAGAPVWWAPGVDYTAQMQAAYAAWLAGGVDRWPRLRVVFSFLAGGAPFQLERLRARGADTAAAYRPTIFLETSSYGRYALDLCVSVVGVEQLLFGSDAPVLEIAAGLAAVESLGPELGEPIRVANPTQLLQGVSGDEA